MTVQVLTTGGTIASRPAPNGSVSVAMSGVELISGAAPVREILRKHSGPIGEVRQGQVRIWSTPVRPAGFRLPPQLAPVDIVASYVGAGGNQLAACRAGGAEGIVLEALGAGNPTPAVLAEVRTCVDAGLPVLVTSRCAAGPTTPIYGAGGGADLIRAGAVMAGGLPSSKARILLSIALASESLHLINAHLR